MDKINDTCVLTSNRDRCVSSEIHGTIIRDGSPHGDLWAVIFVIRTLNQSILKMGKSNSKIVNNSGDPQNVIINQLEEHSEHHTAHDLKLTVILVAVVLQFLLICYLLLKKHSRKQALKAARSVAQLQHVWKILKWADGMRCVWFQSEWIMSDKNS